MFDLGWYLGDPGWPGPNPELLKAALRQGDRESLRVTGETWRASMAERVRNLDWDAIHGDVRPFLERGVGMAGRGELLRLPAG